VKEQLQSFLEFLRLNRNASPHTVAAYDSDLSQFLAFTAAQQRKKSTELRPADIDLPAVRAFMADLYRQGQARASVSRKLSALRTFTRYMRREGWIEPAYEERRFDAFRAYYSYVPKGSFLVEYTLRLNNAGSFVLPTTRVEAMYAPEMFGELPNEALKVRVAR